MGGSRKRLKAQKGFTLIELMMAMAITVVVLGALIMSFSEQQKMFSQQTELTQTNAAVRAALQIMSRDIRLAGYTGVPLGWQEVVEEAAKAGTFAETYPIISLKDGTITMTSSYSLIDQTALSLKSVTGTTDVVEIRGNFLRDYTTLTSVVNPGSNSCSVQDATVLAGEGFNKPAWVIFGEPTKTGVRVEIFKIASVDKDSNSVQIVGQFKNDLGMGTGEPKPEKVIVAPVFRRIYFVRTDLTDKRGNPQPALFVANYWASDTGLPSGDKVLELARGVTNLQLSYQLKSSGLKIQNQGMFCDPCKVRSVDIKLFTVSEKFRAKNPLIREYTHGVKIRNIGFNPDRTCAIPGCAI